jgi:hypothetical protein
MKYYETNYDEYLNSYENYNLHPELDYIKNQLPLKIQDFKNMIIYGPSGVGKYTQVLSIIQKYSPSKLKYDKKICITYEKQEKKTKTISTTEKKVTKKKVVGNAGNIIIKKTEKKQEYIYRISDIHYEIDMATLGCNSKLVWHDIFFQIVDIVSVSSEKNGIIICKNFHIIHNELLEIFYSYMRHPLHHNNIQIQFILITEHIGFIPDNILNVCETIHVKRPCKEQYIEMAKLQKKTFSCFLNGNREGLVYDRNNKTAIFYKNKTEEIVKEMDITSIMNSKEIHSFAWLKMSSEIPKDVFNVICDTLLKNILNPSELNIINLRNNLYDLLIYNVDIYECIWYLFTTLILNGNLKNKQKITELLNDQFVFFKYYNNNYRAIYHLESIILSMINKIHYGESVKDIGNKENRKNNLANNKTTV